MIEVIISSFPNLFIKKKARIVLVFFLNLNVIIIVIIIIVTIIIINNIWVSSQVEEQIRKKVY